MRIVFFASSLSAGGAERVLSILAHALAERGHEVGIATLAAVTTDFYAVAPAIQRVGLDALADSEGLVQAVLSNAGRVRKLRKVLRALAPEVLVSFCDRANVLALLASRGLGFPVIVSERTDPSRHDIGLLWSGLRRRVYPWADAVVVQTEAVAGWVRKEIPGTRPLVIPNPVRKPARTRDFAAGTGSNTGGTVIGLGRLSPEKGFDRLLRAFAAVAPDFPDWRLKLLGDGPLRDALEIAAAVPELAGRVEFAGTVPDPAEHLARADLFVLPSRFEGFPNGLLEAMAVGLPAVAFDCPSGPAAIVLQDVDGILIPADDVAALAGGMARLMADEAERRRLGRAALAVAERFGVQAIARQWETLMDEVRA
jgi:glycosyltransferase involved in cell wall biosynthesis